MGGGRSPKINLYLVPITKANILKGVLTRRKVFMGKPTCETPMLTMMTAPYTIIPTQVLPLYNYEAQYNNRCCLKQFDG